MLRSLLTAAVTLSLMAAFATAISAQEIRGMGLSGEYVSIDENTGHATPLGWTGFYSGSQWRGLARSSQNRYYAAYGFWDTPYAIYEIDAQTGSATFVMQTTLIGVTDLTFGPGDILYLMDERQAPFTMGPNDLHTVDLQAGTTTLVGTTGVHSVLGITFSGNDFYGYAYPEGLVHLDPATGAATDVNPQFDGPNIGHGLCSSASGAMYFINYQMYMLDKQTGVASFVHDVPVPMYLSGAVFVDGPQDAFSLWLSGITKELVKVKMSGATPHGQVVVVAARGPGGPTVIPGGFSCAGTEINLNTGLQTVEIVTADGNGKAFTTPQIIPVGAIGRIQVQALDLQSCATSNRVAFAY